MRPPKLCRGLVRNRACICGSSDSYETHLAKIWIVDPARRCFGVHGFASGVGDDGWLSVTNDRMRRHLRTLPPSVALWPVSRRQVASMDDTK